MLYLCHDYPPDSRAIRFATLVADQKETNVHVGGGVKRTAFVEMRETRDSALAVPELILPAIQINIQAGKLPDAEDNDIAYIKIPLDTL